MTGRETPSAKRWTATPRNERVQQFFVAFQGEAQTLVHYKLLNLDEAGAIASAFARIAADLEARSSPAVAALRELVACKDIHDSVENRDMSMSDEQVKQLTLDYQHRKLKAWDAARTALSALPPNVEGEGGSPSQTVSTEALRLAREFVADSENRAEIKVTLEVIGWRELSRMVEEAVIVSRELIRPWGSR